jgi:hypothetical protein
MESLNPAELTVEQSAAPALRVLLDLLLKPRRAFAEAFDDMRNNSRAWLIVALALIALTVLAAYLNTSALVQMVSSIAAPSPATPPGVVNQSAPVGVSPPQEFAPPQPSPAVFILPAVMSAIPLVIGWLVWSVCMQVGSVLIGGRASFGQLFRVVILSQLPLAIRSAIQAIALSLGARPIQRSGFAGFAPQEPGPLNALLQSLLGAVDVFQIWSLVLLVIGSAVVAKITNRKAATLVIVIGLLIILLSSLPQIIFGSGQAIQSAP